MFLPVLEILRGLASLLVVLHHVSWNSHLAGANLVHNSYLMVDLFFVLSGYVMLHAYGPERLAAPAGALRFLRARFARLYPLHLATLAAFLAIECAKWTAVRFQLAAIATTPFSVNNPATLGLHLALLQGMGLEPQPTWNVPAWSIGVEFWLATVYAVLVLALRSTTRIATAAALLALAAGILTWNLEHALTATASHAFYRGMFGFFAGVALRALMPRVPKWLLAPAAIAALLLLTLKPARGPADFLAIPIFAILIATAANPGLPAPRALLWTGKVSYSIYLVHPLVIWCFEFVLQYVLKTKRDGYYAVPPVTGDLLTVLLLAILLPVTAVTYAWIEAPLRKALAPPQPHNSRIG